MANGDRDSIETIMKVHVENPVPLSSDVMLLSGFESIWEGPGMIVWAYYEGEDENALIYLNQFVNKQGDEFVFEFGGLDPSGKLTLLYQHQLQALIRVLSVKQ